jgi:hypothetical protein
MLQAFRLELQYAAMKRKQHHEKQEAERKKNPVGEKSCTSSLSGMEAHGISGQTDCQHDGTEEVSDQVHNRVETTLSGHKAILYFELLSI